MSIKGKFSSDKDSKNHSVEVTAWNDLTSLNELDEIIQESELITIIVFKHSTRCDMSSAMLKRFEQDYNLNADSAKPYFLDVIADREVSNEIALRFEVIHQSPQIIVIKKGRAVYSASHGDILVKDILVFI
ncbi:bacillithiol system redox-active protein YtxJ [Flavobacterium sp. NRK1]|uniref:bacillithiol system redox-active protein YtxJ n=1 Tax=Flavobacterium sp. NRK1 TaxID=2954929 RepID=UPI002092017F|nr:bacillithiol system redox-active protein YtxJ [Flavobacterium sp. NRK1]MCO6146463.1 bacillithiol system redox-active protein YtxJ [Flavobacterium sp. NRK1]